MKYKKIKRHFIKIMKTAIVDIDVSNIGHMYLNFSLLFNRFYPVVLKLQDKECCNGIDFGCGTGGLVVLSHLMGFDMTGIDIAKKGEENNEYTVITSNLNSMGFPIKIFDTLKFPWDFESNSVDAVTAFLSIREEYSSQKKNHLRWSDKKMMDRLSEISRIVKKEGIWYVGPNRHYSAMKSIWHHSSKEKQQRMIRWSQSRKSKLLKKYPI